MHCDGCMQERGFTKAADNANHLSGFSYDAAGNTANDGVNGYQWNAESDLKTAAGVNYVYDGDGRRVSKSNGKLYWYGAGGAVLAETDGSGNTTAEYVFIGGKRVALLPAGSTAQFYAEDMLGSTRVVTTNTGVVCYDADSYPFGGERTYTNSCTQNNYKFEGKERDTETGNDDFGARYYSNRFGRWLSADWSSVPVAVPYANLTNPQTLNLYAMVSDNPETFADLDGHCDRNDWCGVLGSMALSYAKSEVKQFLQGQKDFATGFGQGLAKPGQTGPVSPSNEAKNAGADLARGLVQHAPEIIMAVGSVVGPPAPDFVVTPAGESIPIPDGATGPSPTEAPGMQYQGGAGGKGMDERVSGVRIMDANENQGPRVSYNNASEQKVNPATGRTVSNDDPSAHIPLKPPPPLPPPKPPVPGSTP